MKTIKIKEDVRIPGTDVILEAGDKIEIAENRIAGLTSYGRDMTWVRNKEEVSLEVPLEDGRLSYPVTLNPRLIFAMDNDTKHAVFEAVDEMFSM